MTWKKHVWSGTATQYKINTLRKFFALFGVDPSELIFYLRDQSAPEAQENTQSLNAIRKKYWTVALPMIQAKFGPNNSFCNVHPIGANWIAGYFGIGGFSITCNVTFRSAAVQIYLGKQDTQKNKAAFDYLYQKKNEIEEKLGESLYWERANNSKYSSINYTLKGVSIGNETDCTRMAKFHAEWSKKMSDVIVPYLKELYPTSGD